MCIGALTVSVRPLICSASAVLMNVGSASCFTFTSPQYMNWMRSLRAVCDTSFRKTNACWLAGICVNILRKYGEHTDRTSRWARTSWPSAHSVTSTRSPRHSDSWKPADKFELKLFQQSENCSSSAMLGGCGPAAALCVREWNGIGEYRQCGCFSSILLGCAICSCCILFTNTRNALKKRARSIVVVHICTHAHTHTPRPIILWRSSVSRRGRHYVKIAHTDEANNHGAVPRLCAFVWKRDDASHRMTIATPTRFGFVWWPLFDVLGYSRSMWASFKRGPNVLGQNFECVGTGRRRRRGGHLVFEADEKSMARRRAFVFENVRMFVCRKTSHTSSVCTIQARKSTIRVVPRDCLVGKIVTRLP